MREPYITVTLELSGTNDEALHGVHAPLHAWLRTWRPDVAYGELRIAYQDQDQIDQDAQVEAVPEAWKPDDELL